MLSSNNARLAAARRLTRRSARRETGRFLAEGRPAVREALAAGAVLELFATAEAMARDPELTSGAAEIAPKDAATLSETVTPQGIVAVCALPQPALRDVLDRDPRLLAVLVEPNDPGNLGDAGFRGCAQLGLRHGVHQLPAAARRAHARP